MGTHYCYLVIIGYGLFGHIIVSAFMLLTTLQARGVQPMLVQRWANVEEVGPT